MQSYKRIDKEHIKRVFDKILPQFAVIPLIALIVSNIAVYYGSRLINVLLDRTYLDLTGDLDRMIPVIPGFAVIYLIAFPFWYITYFLICRSDPYKCRATVIANIAAKLFCGFLFIMIPTSITRPAIADEGFSAFLLNFIYTMDSPDNLFPSVHCLESIFCFLLINDEPLFPRGFRLAAFILAVAICLSTLFTKQHILPDVLCGAVIALAAYTVRRSLLITQYRPIIHGGEIR